MRSLLCAAALACGVAGFVALSTAPASALTCSTGNVTYTLNFATDSFCGSGQPDYSADSGTGIVDFDFFGTEHVLASKTDGPDGDGAITFTNAPTSGETAPATWAISDPTGIASQIVLVLKQANSYAAFLISGTSGTWSTSGPGRSVNGLSHADIWYKPGNTEVIPLPASLPLFLAGLGGLGFLGWRRRAAA
jgi:hypothetical protein